GEAPPLAVRRDVDLLVEIGAVEQEGVEAGPTLDRVAAVARVPDERVIARTQQRHVVAGAAVDEIVALAADQRVLAGAPVQRKADLAGLESRGIDPVITRAAIDGQLVGGVGMKDGHRSAGAGDQDSPSADRKQIDRVVAGGAVESVPVRSLIVMVSAPPRAWTSIRSTPLRSIVTLPASRERS